MAATARRMVDRRGRRGSDARLRAIDRTRRDARADGVLRPSARHSPVRIGRELLARAFPARASSPFDHRDDRCSGGLAGTSVSGLAGQLPMAGFEAVPPAAVRSTDLVRGTGRLPRNRRSMLSRSIDRACSGFRRDADHGRLAGGAATGLVIYRRAGRGRSRTATTRAARRGAGPTRRSTRRTCPSCWPTPTTAAADAGRATGHLRRGARGAHRHRPPAGRGFRVDPFLMLFFSDRPGRRARPLRVDVAAILPVDRRTQRAVLACLRKW